MSPYAWEPRVDEGLVTAVLLAAYLLSLRFFPASRGRVAAFGGGILLLVVAFQTPFETISLRYLLSAHLLQNVILAEWAPLLAVLGVSRPMARALARFPWWRLATHPAFALPVWLGDYFFWHVPPVYDAALRHQEWLIHLEHACYFGTGLLF